MIVKLSSRAQFGHKVEHARRLKHFLEVDDVGVAAQRTQDVDLRLSVRVVWRCGATLEGWRRSRNRSSNTHLSLALCAALSGLLYLLYGEDLAIIPARASKDAARSALSYLRRVVQVKQVVQTLRWLICKATWTREGGGGGEGVGGEGGAR